MSTLHYIVRHRLPPRVNVPAQRMRRTNVFAAARGDKTAMRPFAKLLWIIARPAITTTTTTTTTRPTTTSALLFAVLPGSLCSSMEAEMDRQPKQVRNTLRQMRTAQTSRFSVDNTTNTAVVEHCGYSMALLYSITYSSAFAASRPWRRSDLQ